MDTLCSGWVTYFIIQTFVKQAWNLTTYIKNKTKMLQYHFGKSKYFAKKIESAKHNFCLQP